MKVSNEWVQATRLKASFLSLVVLIFALTCGSELRAQNLLITTSSLPAGTMGVAYSATLTATGGGLPYSWSLAFGALPPGLGLSSAGVISGMPTFAGTWTFTVRVRDVFSQTAMKAFSITVQLPPPSITTASPLPPGTATLFYSQALAA